MNVNEAFPSKYVKGTEIPAIGVKVVIHAVRSEKIQRPGAGEVIGWVLWCEGAKRGIILTAALARQLASVLQDDETENWKGKQVILYPEPMTVAGIPRVAIRAKAIDR